MQSGSRVKSLCDKSRFLSPFARCRYTKICRHKMNIHGLQLFTRLLFTIFITVKTFRQTVIKLLRLKAHTPHAIWQCGAIFWFLQVDTKFYNISTARLIYFSYLPKFSIVDRFICVLKNEKSRRVAKSRPVCVGLKCSHRAETVEFRYG